MASLLPGIDLETAGSAAWSGLRFVLVLAVSYVAGRMFRWSYHKTLRGYPTSGQLLAGKLMVLTFTFIGFFVGLSSIYGVQPFSLLATLGIVSLALGFGLQNTVANMAAGVGLTLDKPFDVGDRIQVGQTWGDVQTIGLRSTRIMTVNGDLVVIPNSILDTRELWNYTYSGDNKFRLDVPVGISYESSIQLAESLMLQAARSHEEVLAYPEPAVRAIGFGESSVDLQLRAWINRAQDRPAVRDKLVRAIKHLFDENGVTIPYPQRTVSYLKELDQPAETPDFVKGEAGSKPVVLVCTRGPDAAREMAKHVVDFVERLDARMIVLHVRRPQQAMSPYQAQAAVNIYMGEAQRHKVPARGQAEVGDFPTVLPRVVRETGAKLVIFGKPHTRRLSVGWIRSEVDDAKRSSPVPVVMVDTGQPISDAIAEQWHEHLHPEPQEPEETEEVEQ